MVFSGLLSPPADRASSPSSSLSFPFKAKRSPSSDSTRSYNSDASSSTSVAATVASTSGTIITSSEQIPAPAPDVPEVKSLNDALEVLAAVYPNVQIQVFREMLQSFSEESRLELIANALLKDNAKWVNGRWRVPGRASDSGSSNSSSAKNSARPTAAEDAPLVPRTETFRSDEYRRAVLDIAATEFKSLSRSSIQAVLAETNYSYPAARQTLAEITAKSWRYAISSLFRRKKTPSDYCPENHPLLIWKPASGGAPAPDSLPVLKSSGNAELDRELFDELVVPLRERLRTQQEESDRAVAVQLNTEEAESVEATYDCECCFSTCAFEDFASCTQDGHMVCLDCVQRCVEEAVFGQGWLKYVEKDTGTLLCPAAGSSDECTGRIPADHMNRALLRRRNGYEVLRKLDHKLADHSMGASNMPLVRCPFCDYAEVNDIYVPPEDDIRLRPSIAVHLFVFAIQFLIPLLILLAYALMLLALPFNLLASASAQLDAAKARFRQRRRGLRFRCRSPWCGRASCTSCSKAWSDPHVCHESELVALRTAVETAMSQAIKRVCPQCNTSFVKLAGCNKMTCSCGYKMCYVCRASLGGRSGPGYRHFCEHFRPDADGGAPCPSCQKCSLWQKEDEAAVLRAAREEAETKWRDQEGRDLSASEKQYLDQSLVGERWNSRHRYRPTVFVRRFLATMFTSKRPGIEDLYDVVAENIYVMA